MYCGVPMRIASWVRSDWLPRIFEMPKSRTFTFVGMSSSGVQRKTLSGLRSRWTTPAR
jgi:hypothetical protein